MDKIEESEGYNVDIIPFINKFKEDSSRFDRFYQTTPSYDDMYYGELRRAIDGNPEVFPSLPSPLSPNFNSKVLKKKEFKVREIIKIPAKEQSIAFSIPFISAAMEANSRYKFEISHVVGQPSLISLPFTDSEKDWFWDFNIVTSKLTVICQLSKPEEYEGGDHVIRLGENVMTLPKEKYDTVVFPSFALQKLKKITKGTRKYMIAHLGSQFYK